MMTSCNNAGRLYLAIAAIDDGERVGGLNLVSREEIDGLGKAVRSLIDLALMSN